AGQLVPIEATVEADAEPPAMPDVRGDEELVRIGIDEHPLHSLGRSAPDRKAPVAVMVVHDHQERLLLPDEERRRAMTEALARVRQGETDLAEPRQDVVLVSRS